MAFSKLRFIILVQFGLLRANYPSLQAITPEAAEIRNGTAQMSDQIGLNHCENDNSGYQSLSDLGVIR